jgi:hypothetical protein
VLVHCLAGEDVFQVRGRPEPVALPEMVERRCGQREPGAIACCDMIDELSGPADVVVIEVIEVVVQSFRPGDSPVGELLRPAAPSAEAAGRQSAELNRHAACAQVPDDGAVFLDRPRSVDHRPRIRPSNREPAPFAEHPICVTTDTQQGYLG